MKRSRAIVVLATVALAGLAVVLFLQPAYDPLEPRHYAGELLVRLRPATTAIEKFATANGTLAGVESHQSVTEAFAVLPGGFEATVLPSGTLLAADLHRSIFIAWVPRLVDRSEVQWKCVVIPASHAPSACNNPESSSSRASVESMR